MITNNRWRKAVTDDSDTIANNVICFTNGGGSTDISLDHIIEDNRTTEPVKSDEQLAAEKAAAESKAAEEAKSKVAAEELEKTNKIVAEKFGAVTLDAEGNAIDATGKVVKTKAEIEKAILDSPPEAIEIDGKQYKLDKDGNALGEDGKVFKTKVEIDAIVNEDTPLVLELIQKVGIHPTDAKGNPKTYEDSIEGLIELNNDIAEIKRIQNEKALFAAYPRVEKYLRHIASGGDDKTFFDVVKNDYSKVVLDEKNVEQHKNLYRELLLEKGFTLDKANKLVEQSVAANEILNDGKESLLEHQKNQKAREAKMEEDNAARIAAEEKEITDHWDNVKNIVTKGQLDKITIPEVDRIPFFDYIAKAVDDNGNSQASIARNKETLETRLLFDYYRYKGYNFDKLIQNAANTKLVSSLRSRFNKKQNTVSHPSGSEAEGSIEEVNIDNVK